MRIASLLDFRFGMHDLWIEISIKPVELGQFPRISSLTPLYHVYLRRIAPAGAQHREDREAALNRNWEHAGSFDLKYSGYDLDLAVFLLWLGKWLWLSTVDLTWLSGRYQDRWSCAIKVIAKESNRFRCPFIAKERYTVMSQRMSCGRRRSWFHSRFRIYQRVRSVLSSQLCTN